MDKLELVDIAEDVLDQAALNRLIPRGFRVVVIVTDKTMDVVGVSSTAPAADTRLMLQLAMFGDKRHAPKKRR